MNLRKEQVEALSQGFLQVGIALIIYIIFSVIGFITTILVGLILPENVSGYIQAILILLTQLGAMYMCYKATKEDSQGESA